MKGYLIYYEDDTVYSGAPEKAPALGVQVIIQPDENNGWYSQTGGDYYVWDDRGTGYRWWGVDIFGLFEYFLSPGWKRVLCGKTIPSERYQEIFFRAKEDAGPKSGFRRKERRP